MKRETSNTSESYEEKKTNKEKILSCLLEGPKTITELLRSLGYKENQQNVIGGVLSRLRDKDKFITYEKIDSKRLKNTEIKLYSLIQNLENFKSILKEFPDLLPQMQKNDLVLDTIVNTHSELICNTTDEKYMELVPRLKSIYQNGIKSWKEKLKLSGNFFGICLNNKTFDLFINFKKLIKISDDDWYSNIWEVKTSPTSWVYLWATVFRIDIAFKACVHQDILQGQSNEKAIEYVKQMNNKVSENQINELKKYYANNRFAPEYLRGKKLIPVENNRLREIEQEFIDNGGEFV